MGIEDILDELGREIDEIVSTARSRLAKNGLDYLGIPTIKDKKGRDVPDPNAIRAKMSRNMILAGAKAIERKNQMAKFTLVDPKTNFELLDSAPAFADEPFEYVPPLPLIKRILNSARGVAKKGVVGLGAAGLAMGMMNFIPEDIQENVAEMSEQAFLDAPIIPQEIKNDVIQDRLSLDGDVITIDGTILGSLVKDLEGRTTYGVPLLAYIVKDDGRSRGIAFSDRSGFDMETLQSLMSSIRDGNEIKVRASRLIADGSAASYDGIPIYIVQDVDYIRNPLPNWEKHDDKKELESLEKILLKIPEPQSSQEPAKQGFKPGPKPAKTTSVDNREDLSNANTISVQPTEALERYILPVFHEGFDQYGYYLLGPAWTKFYFDPEK